MIHFVAPVSESALEDILSTDVDDDYPYWIGSANWITQSYLVLREYREDITIGTAPSAKKINFAHVTTWRTTYPKKMEYRVSIRADYRQLFNVDFEIIQNPSNVKWPNQTYITYWPVPRMIPRKEDRKDVVNIAYAGRIGKRNIDTDLQASNLKRCLDSFKFKVIDQQCWHDMSEIDVLIAIRDFSTRTYPDKPPSKLINAWNAGIPLIAGYDSSFSTIGTPGVDYIRVKTKDELSSALERLRDDPNFYDSIVQAGYRKRLEYTREKIAQTWLSAIDGPILSNWKNASSKSMGIALSNVRNLFLDNTINSLSSTKGTLQKSLNSGFRA